MRDYQLAHGEVRVICGDSREGLRLLPDQSVHCCITSPPYWGLRAYLPEDHPDKPKELGGERLHDCGGWVTGSRCGECYVCHMVDLFREVRRVLRGDGTLWLNLGDAYAGAWGNYGGQNRGKGTQRQIVKGSQAPNAAYDGLERWRPPNSYNLPGLKQKDLCGMPWRTALALQADGWWLRSDIIWSKTNGMPSSVRDRPGCSHEYVFLLAKSDRYFYDCDAIRDAHKPESIARMKNRKANMPRDRCDADQLKGGNWNDYQDRETGWGNPCGANARTVWHIPTSSGRKEGSHFAVFSPRLVMRCLLAGTSSRGVCAACGAPWQRVVEREKFQRPKEYRRHAGESGHNNPTGKVPGSNTRDMPDPHVTTVGWAPGCDCGADVAQAVVLDPFGGSGVVASVALQKRRRAVLLELNPDYVEIIKHKIRKAEKNRGFGL